MKQWLMSRVCNRNILKKIIYIVCFFLFVVIDQRVKSLPSREGWLFAWQNALGIVVAMLIMTHYKWDDFRKHKLVYILWTIFSAVGGSLYYIWRSKQEIFFANANLVLIVAVILFGYILIHTYINVIVDKNMPQIRKSFFITWAVMMLLMIFSRSEFSWPLGYLIIFGCFYLTDFSKYDIHEMLVCACIGFVLAFVFLQGLAFVFRPFDSIRYLGLYTNSNQNALFYLTTLVAMISLRIHYKKKSCRIIDVLFGIGICIVLDLLFLTQGRTALFLACLFVLIMVGILYVGKNKFYVIKKLLLLLISTVIIFPLCFASVRYMPAVFHHPIWFDGEWAEHKVHSWDTWDSPKYTDIEEFESLVFERVLDTFSGLLKNSPFVLSVNAEESTPMLTPEEGNNSVLVRKTIYQYYLENLQWFGQPYSEQGVQITKLFFTYHAHNLYLQYGTDFGIPVMVLLIVLVIWSCCIYGKRIYKESNIEDIAMLMFILVPALYGILEYSWGVGSIGTTMLFLAWRIPEWKN